VRAAISPRREALLQAAVRLFAAKGYHATSMQDIAEALGIQRGSIYYHITTKEDLLYEIMESSIKLLTARVEGIVSLPAPAGDRLRRFVEVHLEMLASMRAEFRVFLAELKSLSPGRRASLEPLRDHHERLLQTIIREGRASGEFREVHPRFAAFTVLSVCNWSCQWYSPRGAVDRAEVASILADVLLRGLAMPK
jgi:AcrR family transcriptional regulator